MGAPQRRCLNCGKPLLGGPNQRACNASCRQQLKRKRDRRAQTELRKRDAAMASAPGALAARDDSNSDVSELIGRKQEDVVREAFVEELRPVLRSAIDAGVIKAIESMVGLAPAAVSALQDDLEGDDPYARSRAAALVVKYTMGNPHVTPAREDNKPGLTIINQMPDAPAPFIDADLEDAPSGDLKRCDTCRLDKPVEDFPADGPRCAQCMEERKAAVIDSLLPAASDSLQARPEPVDHPGAIQRAPQQPAVPAPQRFPGAPDPYRFSNG